ncbi:MAG: hypothetical protein IPM16_17250 [Chloroflexi bacterium]|nr:hypothetical protein [Chloroflexota bacterium]
MKKFRILTIAAVFAALLLGVTVASAGVNGVVIVSEQYTCSGVAVVYEVPSFTDYSWSVTVDGQLIANGSGFNQTYTTLEVTATDSGSQLSPFPFTSGDHVISVFVSTGFEQYNSVTVGDTINCDPTGDDDDDDDDDTPVLVSGRACFGPGEVAAAVYVTRGAIEIWAIDSSDRGQLAIRVSAAELEDLDYTPGTPLLIEESDLFISIQLWRQANGLYRVLVGPDGEGKMFECAFGGKYSAVRSWLPGNEPSGELDSAQPEASAASLLISALRVLRLF